MSRFNYRAGRKNAPHYTFTLEIEIDAQSPDEARETERAIAEDILNWPAVVSVQGDVPKVAA